MTDYIQSVLDDISDDGMTPDLWDLVNEDIENMKGVGVSNKKEKALLFYIRRFMNDILDDFGTKRQPGITKKVFEMLKDKEDVSIDDIKNAVSSCFKTKRAYPNTTGVYREYNHDKVDINKWITTMANINQSEDEIGTLEQLTSSWNETEKYNFIQWMKYYEENSHMKYGFDKKANYLNFVFDHEMEQALKDPVLGQEEEVKVEPEVQIPQKRIQTLQDYKKSLVSRLMSAERLLAKFVDVLPEQKWQFLYDTLTRLKGEATQLKVAQTINDRVIRAANIFDDNDFQEGAQELRKIAAPAGNIAKRIEKALGGGEGAEEGAGAADLGDDLMDMPNELDLPGGEAGPGGETPPMDEPAPDEGLDAPPAGDELDVPEPDGGEEPSPDEPDLDVPEPTTEEPELDVSEPAGADNPFAGSNPEDVINIINPLLQSARSRVNVRILTKADMMLEGLGVASYLPELSEAIGKQIECDNYIANRLEKIIGKLQGSKGGDSAAGALPPSAPAPSVDMGEITGEETLDVEEPEETLDVEEPEEAVLEEVPVEAPKAPPVAEKEEKVPPTKTPKAPAEV